MDKFDITVIGAGPGGYVAAIKAAQNGASVALVEKNALGGTCLNVGCIPTKTLLASADVLHQAQRAAEFGVTIDGAISADFTAMQQRKTDVVSKLRAGVAQLVKANKISLFPGEASFLSRKQIQITDADESQVIESEKVIIATGSEPVIPGFLPTAPQVLDSTGILALDAIPASLLVLGGGVIGCEFASLFARLGSQVTIVEMLDRLVPMQDADVSRVLTTEFKKMGITVLTGTALEDIAIQNGSVSGKVGETEVSGEFLLVAIGRKPVTTGLNVKKAGLALERNGTIAVDQQCRTSVPGIFAIGDVTGRVQLAHMASAMAICAANNATGTDDILNDHLVPGCLYSYPEVGSVGLSSAECKEKGIDVKTGKFFFSALGKAMAIGEASGFCKIIADAQTDQVLGVHIVGPHATDLISEAATGMALEITASELGKVIHAHPTLSEIIMEAAHAVHDTCIHAPPKRRTPAK